MSSRPTIHDVAREAGVSISTVSHVLNGTRPISIGTTERVRAAVVSLGYEPNARARQLKADRSFAIGLVVPDVMNPFFAEVTSGVEEELRRRDVLLALCATEAHPSREEYYVQLLRRRRVDGVIFLSGTGLPAAELAALADRESVVFVDERVPGVEAPFVGSDNRRGARLVAEHVLSRGHRQVAIVGGPPALWTAEQRLAGYREALLSHGIEPDGVPHEAGDYRLDSGRDAARLLLNGQRNRPTALLVANDLMAIGAFQECRALGLAVPDQVSIAGYDDIPEAAFLTPALTTVRQPAVEMGRAAARVLLDRIEGRPVQMLTDIPAELIVRESVTEIHNEEVASG